MNAFVAAGGIPGPDDPLFEICQGQPKAMLSIAGKPMVQWVIDALDGASSIDHIAVVGLDDPAGITSRKALTFVPDQGGLLHNMMAGLEHVRQIDPDQELALYAAADIPGITPEMVDWRTQIALQSPGDIDYVAVERKVMEARFPTSNRSYVKFRDVEVCGSDINVVSVSLIVREALWDRIVEARKTPMRQAAMIGFDTLILMLLRRLTLHAAEQRICQRLDLDGHAHLSPYAEVAMDVDKPHQFEILRAALETRQESLAS
jgi:GTP:adenosylcobinamide-phosphate guanylyltransferase